MGKKVKLGILYGGKSAEHNVSLQTAMSVMNAVDHERFTIKPIYITDQGKWLQGKEITGKIENTSDLKIKNSFPETHSMIPGPSFLPSISGNEADGEADFDVIFPLLHGPNGEDGTVQGLLELLNVPYVGNGVLASAVGMDKVMMKTAFAQAGLKQPAYIHFKRKDWKNSREQLIKQIEQKLGFPCFVKPANLGSSVGISKSTDSEDLEKAINEALQFDRKVIVEEGIDGREIEIGILGNHFPKCSVAGEIVSKDEFYDYNAKYIDGNTALIIPANLNEATYKELQNLAITAFKTLDGTGLARADFFLTTEGELLINEVNTMPGFTPYSMFPLLWKETGISYSQLIEKLIELGMEDFQEKQSIKYTLDD
ncbi:D-alanine--D-alanine ligase [Pseudalkalibacillus caeni]|uniref:D-alanine--D-alanine ligase n=1 Tax=Exobacillus caeni TaxID=2574798 RepID=A0A5R9F1Y6_9BACL|nr:D-alanine--D-alanine ligase [Pseudalkalibacillus caeni]TLS37597.1 D-alanine--D-alanine ligase [Pseudalkalibacillus caeni]